MGSCFAHLSAIPAAAVCAFDLGAVQYVNTAQVFFGFEEMDQRYKAVVVVVVVARQKVLELIKNSQVNIAM